MVLEVRDLHVTFGPARRRLRRLRRSAEGAAAEGAAAEGAAAVRGLSFALDRGQVLGVAGASGSGKTAAALAVTGLLPPGARASGSVRLCGRELLGAADAELAAVRGKDISMVFQDPLAALTPVYPVGDQIAETVRVHAGAGRRAARARAVRLLDLVGVPDPARSARAYPHELSGGMRQRAMIAMAVANDPQVIVADEPTTALDVTVQAQVLEVLRTAQQVTGAAVLLVTHDFGVIAELADRVLVMRAGRTVEEGPLGELARRPADPYTAALLRPTPESSAPHLGGGAPDRNAGPAVPAPRAGERPAVLEVAGLARHFTARRGRVRRSGVVAAVDGIGFAVREGETLGLVGESGSGKTTTLREILRLAAPQRGRVTVFGRDAAALSPRERRELRRHVQVVFQDPLASLDPRMPVADLVAEPLAAQRRPRDEAAARVAELLGLVGLDPALAARFPGTLSGGQRQRVCIARALATAPRLVLLDEPVSALDVPVRAGVLALLADLKARLGLTYLLVSHDLGVVRRLADRVAVMYRGRIVEIGSAERLYRAPAHPYTRALLAAVPSPDPARPRRPMPPPPRDAAAASRPHGAVGGVGAVGCGFRARCGLYAALGPGERARCDRDDPELREASRTAGGADHRVACHHEGGER